MDTESLLVAVALFALLGGCFKYLRRRRERGESAPEHFFGAMDDDTAMLDVRSRHSPPGHPRG